MKDFLPVEGLMALCYFGMLGMWHSLRKEVVSFMKTAPESEKNESVVYFFMNVHMPCICKPVWNRKHSTSLSGCGSHKGRGRPTSLFPVIR